MDTELLKTFLEIQRTRHFAKAAENLYLTPSAVSFRVRQLESALGESLFLRERNNIRLTPAGERLVPHAESMLLAWQRAQQEVGLNEQFSAQVAVAAPANVWDAYLRNALIFLYRQKADLVLRSEVLQAADIARRVLEHSYDIGIAFEAPNIERLHRHKLLDLELILVASEPDLSVETAMQQGYIKVDWGTAFNNEHARCFGAQPSPRMSTASATLAKQLLLETGGSAYLPRHLVQKALDQQRLFGVPNAPTQRRALYAMILDEKADSAPMQELLTILTNAIQPDG